MSFISLGGGPVVPWAEPAWVMICTNGNIIGADTQWQRESFGGNEARGGWSKMRSTFSRESSLQADFSLLLLVLYQRPLSNEFDKADGQKRWTRVIKRYYLHCESQTGPHRQCPVFLWASIPVKEWNVRLVLCRVWLTTRRCRRFKHKCLFVCLYLRHLSWEVSGASPALSHTRSPIWGDKDGNRVFQQRKVHLSPWQRERWKD